MKKHLYLSCVCLFASALYAESFTFQEDVRVSNSQREYHGSSTSVPYQECWDEQVEVPSSSSGNEGTVGAIIGGVAGGVLGHQVGGGTGKTAATIGGAVVGTMVGKNVAENNSGPTYKTQRRCTTRYEERNDGAPLFRNTAYYKNQPIVKYSDRPLDYIRINVTVSY